MNYYLHMNHNEFHMDFVVTSDIETPYREIIEKNGGCIHVIPPPWPFPLYLRTITRILEQGNYDIFHANAVNVSIPFLREAKKRGVPVRILHAHESRSAEIKWKEIRNNMLTPLALIFANEYFACSKISGDFLFGSRPYTVIRNALNIRRFRFNAESRGRIRALHDAQTKTVIGTVGRTSLVKNPFFALDVFLKLHKKNPNTVYWWIGTGPLDEQVKAYAEKTGISKAVHFLGDIKDIQDYYSAIDAFMLPSICEGFPVTAVEAQAAGLPLFLSDQITKEIDITGNCIFLPIDNSEIWAYEISSRILQRNKGAADLVRKNGYDISSAIQALENSYASLTAKHRGGEA